MILLSGFPTLRWWAIAAAILVVVLVLTIG